LKKLAADSGATKLRFFGKIRGTENDYYVAEAEGGGEEGGGEEGAELPPDFEAAGSGVNKFSYWVSHSSLGTWTKLPDISPSDLNAGRAIKILFSGDLERPIYADPYYFKANKTEKFYLRAQIARIVHSTTLCPKGLFRLIEDNPREVEDNAPEEGDIVLPSTAAMTNIGMWVHNNNNILLNNRTSHMEPEAPEDSELTPEDLLKIIEAKDPYEKRLKQIDEDNKVIVSKNMKICPWVVKEMGDSTEYKTEAGKTVCNGVVVVRSLQWPGSYNFYYQGRYLNIYVGNGHKYEVASYFPVNPPIVLADPDEYDI